MVVIDPANLQQCLPYLLYEAGHISICCGKQGIIPIKVLRCYATVKMIAAFYEPVETIHCVQMIKAFLIFCHLAAVFDRTVCNRGQDMITPETIAEDQCCVSDMTGKHSPKFFRIRFCPVHRSGIGISIPLNTAADTDIFAGNAAFFSLRTMFAGLSGDIAI